MRLGQASPLPFRGSTVEAASDDGECGHTSRRFSVVSLYLSSQIPSLLDLQLCPVPSVFDTSVFVARTLHPIRVCRGASLSRPHPIFLRRPRHAPIVRPTPARRATIYVSSVARGRLREPVCARVRVRAVRDTSHINSGRGIHGVSLYEPGLYPSESFSFLIFERAARISF